MDEIWQKTGCEVAALARTRAASATDIARAAIARLEAVNPALNAVVECRPDDVLRQAAAIDAAIARGEDPGPLAGVPITVKVNLDQAGFATTNGVTLRKDCIAASDSPVVASLRAAGAIILGRTNTPAFSYRWFTANRLHGRTLNPHDPKLTPGGSSGGAAAAVAAGIGAIAHGTDIAGSIRYPAYACGVHGLRPTFGRIAAFNGTVGERNIGAQLTAVSGPLARSIEDLRVTLAVLARPDARDPWWVPAPLAGPTVPRRAALCTAPGQLATCAAVRDALVAAASKLEAAGWQVDAVEDLPPLNEAAELQRIIWLGDGFSALMADAEAEGDPGALALLRFHAGHLTSVESSSILAALTRRATILREWLLFLERYPVVLMPVSGELPFETDLDIRDADSFERVWRAQTPQVGIPFLGLPSLSMSTGLAEGRPVGIQIVATRFREDLCLQAADDILGAGSRIAVVG